MKRHVRICRNIPFALSAGAYLLLAVPATETGLVVGVLLTIACFALGLFLPDIWHYTKENATKGHWIAAGAVCLLMGFRFDHVWKLSSQVSALTSMLSLDKNVFLTAIGCVSAVGAVYFAAATLTWLLKIPLRLLNDMQSKPHRQLLSCRLLIGIVVLLTAQLGLLCYWGVQKQGFHVDEIYTFELSNYSETIYGDGKNAYASWKNGEIFREILEPADGRLFDLSVPFWNGETDNHPSTYYILVNIISSVFRLFGIAVNKWAGLIPNFICCLVTTVFLVLLLQDLLNDDILALSGGIVWAFCIGTVNIGVYLRMYALMTMAAVVFIWLHLKVLSSYSKQESVRNTLVMLQMTTIAGILSQYYFLIFAFFFCGFVCIYLFLKRERNLLRCYILTEISAVAAAELLFPRMIVQLLLGGRGSEALENMLKGRGYFTQLQTVVDMISRELFGGYGVAVLTVSTILLLVSIAVRRSRKEPLSFSDLFVLLMLMTAGGYILVVTKIAPYQVDRYFMCVFPLLIVYAVYGICRGITTLICGNCIGAFGISAVLVAFVLWHTGTGEVSYIYSDSTERMERIKQYVDMPVVVLNGDHYNDSVLQWAFEFQMFENVFLCRNNRISDMIISAEDGKLDEGFLLYVHQDNTDTAELFAQISEMIEIEHYFEITDTRDCRVFYCSIQQK